MGSDEKSVFVVVAFWIKWSLEWSWSEPVVEMKDEMRWVEWSQVGPMRTDGSRSVGAKIAYMSVRIWLSAGENEKVLVRCGGGLGARGARWVRRWDWSGHKRVVGLAFVDR